MHRRYNRWWSRFEQSDPFDGSYNLTDPQSFNRYAYVQNDPVNFTDPTGLFPNVCPPEMSGPECMGTGFWGGGGNINDRRSILNPSGREIIALNFNTDVRFVAIFQAREWDDAQGNSHITFWWEKDAWVRREMSPIFGALNSWPPDWPQRRPWYRFTERPQTPSQPTNPVQPSGGNPLDNTQRQTGARNLQEEFRRVRGPNPPTGWGAILKGISDLFGPGVKGIHIVPPVILTPEIKCAALKIGCGLKA